MENLEYNKHLEEVIDAMYKTKKEFEKLNAALHTQIAENQKLAAALEEHKAQNEEMKTEYNEAIGGLLEIMDRIIKDLNDCGAGLDEKRQRRPSSQMFKPSGMRLSTGSRQDQE